MLHTKLIKYQERREIQNLYPKTTFEVKPDRHQIIWNIPKREFDCMPETMELIAVEIPGVGLALLSHEKQERLLIKTIFKGNLRLFRKMYNSTTALAQKKGSIYQIKLNYDKTQHKIDLRPFSHTSYGPVKPRIMLNSILLIPVPSTTR